MKVDKSIPLRKHTVTYRMYYNFDRSYTGADMVLKVMARTPYQAMRKALRLISSAQVALISTIRFAGKSFDDSKRPFSIVNNSDPKSRNLVDEIVDPWKQIISKMILKPTYQ